MRCLLIFVFTGVVLATSLEDSAAALAQKVLTHLMPDEIANITWRDGATNELKSAFARALQRRIRNPKQVEVHAYLSENFKGPLLIAEIVRDNGNVVEMVGASRDGSVNALLPLKLALLWEQQTQILDVAFLNDQMFVLDLNGLVSYRRQDGQWHLIETNPIASAQLRDPRGRIDVTKNPLLIYLPGRACTKNESTAIRCEPGGILTAGRNTMSEEGWPVHYTYAELGEEHIFAETDGRIHFYDSSRTPSGSFDSWGSDFVVLNTSCGGQKVLASEASIDAVALYGIANRQPIRMSDPAALPGPITAMWPQGAYGTVIAKNSKTGRYEAYSASLNCGN